MDAEMISGLLTAGGSILIIFLGYGLKIGGQHFAYLRREKVRRLIYDVVKGQVRSTMPAVILGKAGKTGGISTAVAKKRVITAALGILGPLAQEFLKMGGDTQEAVVNAAVHSVKKESRSPLIPLGINTATSKKGG